MTVSAEVPCYATLQFIVNVNPVACHAWTVYSTKRNVNFYCCLIVLLRSCNFEPDFNLNAPETSKTHHFEQFQKFCQRDGDTLHELHPLGASGASIRAFGAFRLLAQSTLTTSRGLGFTSATAMPGWKMWTKSNTFNFCRRLQQAINAY
jgi:hypothetical protein